MKKKKGQSSDDEGEALLDDSPKSYSADDHGQRQSSRLDWAEASWFRCLHVLCLWWINPLLSLGYNRKLTDDDLDDLSNDDKASVLLNKMSACDCTTATSTWNMLLRAFWKPFLLGGLLLFPYMVVHIAQPMLLRQIVLFIIDHETSSFAGYFYAAALFICSLVQICVHHQFFFRTKRLGVRIRNALTSVIYMRLLSMNMESLQQITAAQTINFIVTDAAKFEYLFEYIHYLWAAPLETVIVFALLCWIIGPLPALFGFVIFIFFIFVQLLFSRSFSRYCQTTVTCADKRIQVFNEVINGCLVVKTYNWEEPMEKHVLEMRQNEFASIKRASTLRAVNMGLLFSSESLAALCTFGGAWLMGRKLEGADIFTVLALYGQLRLPVLQSFPLAIEKLSEVWVAIKRIDGFMRMTIKQQQMQASPNGEQEKKGRVVMRDASFSWSIDKTCLSLLNIDIEPGALVIITGSVGSGKSSFLTAILGEMNLINGQIYVNHNSFSYAAQSSWIFADTLRANILLGKPLDEQRYSNVLRACCLDIDLSLFGPSGDLTMIGERGVNLSGGQKARVSLARALYIDADIYLLDDPLAAVDRTVAKKIYDQCIGPRGLISKKTRLLVTHQAKFVSDSHKTILLENGRIRSQSHFDDVSFESENIDRIDDADKDGENISVAMLDIRGQSTTDTQSIIADEVSVSGTVSWSVWIHLFTAPPLGWFGLCLFIVLFILGEALYDGANCWLSVWSARSYAEQQRIRTFAEIYLILTMATLAVLVGSACYFFYLILNGSNNLHNEMLNALLNTSMRFFESNPSGRILNRATKDQQVIDEVLPMTLFAALQFLMLTFGALTVIAVINPWILFLLPPLIPILWFLQRFYLRSSRQIKRLESVARSPIYSLFDSTLNGLTTIRAFKVKDDFVQSFLNKLDVNTRACIVMQSVTHWFGLRLDLMATVFGVFIAVLSVIRRNHVDSSAVALSLMYCMNMAATFQWGVRQAAEAQHFIISAERIDEYARLPREEDESDKKLLIETPTNWPNRGTIEFRNYSLRYRLGLAPVLKNINLYIQPGEKIGVIGRTGMCIRIYYRCQSQYIQCFSDRSREIQDKDMKFPTLDRQNPKACFRKRNLVASLKANIPTN
jgi:ABC-type multidrug transport system fused ATPase/permease subunit